MERWKFGRWKHTAQHTHCRNDIVGRVQTYEAIVKGENIPEPGIPESFKVLIKEMQSLALDVRVLTEDNEEIQIKEVSEYDDVSGIDGIMDVDTELESEEKLFAEGFTEETPDDDMTESFADDEL